MLIDIYGEKADSYYIYSVTINENTRKLVFWTKLI